MIEKHGKTGYNNSVLYGKEGRTVPIIVIHVVFAVGAAAVFARQYMRYRLWYQVGLAVLALSTLLTYISQNRVYITILSVTQLALLFACIFSMCRYRGLRFARERRHSREQQQENSTDTKQDKEEKR